MEHIFCEEEYEVLNFTDCPFNMLVTRSDHWYKERGIKIPRQRQLGIVVDRKFYQDGRGRIICWPVVAWEGDITSSLTHPMNVISYRKKQILPIIKMDNGQWGTRPAR